VGGEAGNGEVGGKAGNGEVGGEVGGEDDGGAGRGGREEISVRGRVGPNPRTLRCVAVAEGGGGDGGKDGGGTSEAHLKDARQKPAKEKLNRRPRLMPIAREG
jgi:hypothetical protein